VYRVVGHGHREWRQGEAEQGRREQPQGQARGRDSNTERPYVRPHWSLLTSQEYFCPAESLDDDLDSKSIQEYDVNTKIPEYKQASASVSKEKIYCNIKHSYDNDKVLPSILCAQKCRALRDVQWGYLCRHC